TAAQRRGDRVGGQQVEAERQGTVLELVGQCRRALLIEVATDLRGDAVDRLLVVRRGNDDAIQREGDEVRAGRGGGIARCDRGRAVDAARVVGGGVVGPRLLPGGLQVQ